MEIDRDVVALAVLHGMVSSPPEGINRQDANTKQWAKKAFEFADAFITERNKER